MHGHDDMSSSVFLNKLSAVELVRENFKLYNVFEFLARCVTLWFYHFFNILLSVSRRINVFIFVYFV